jgi:K+-transporting ATPase ATPase A chain
VTYDAPKERPTASRSRTRRATRHREGDRDRADTPARARRVADRDQAARHNGGGFYNVNSAHPFENPTPLANFLETLAILLIAAALCYTFGKMIGDTRQGWGMLAAMTLIFVPLSIAVYVGEGAGNPVLTGLGADQVATATNPGGNMEGKEVRFGVANSALWATATTAASNGSVNSMHDSFMPLSGMVPMWLIQLGEVVYGGVGLGAVRDDHVRDRRRSSSPA